MKPHAFLAVLLSGVMVPALAVADPSSADRATARALGLEGEEALESKDYATARERYARAEALFHAPTLLLGLARAQVGLGKLIDAQETYLRIVNDGVPPSAPPVFLEAVASAESELSAVKPRIAWLTIVVNGAAAPTVWLDGDVLPAATFGARRAVDPGTHTILAVGSASLEKKVSVALADGKAETIVLDFAPQGAPPPPLVPVAPPEGRALPAPRGSRALAYVLFGVGGVSAVAGAIFTGLAASSYQAFNANPTQDGANLTLRNARIADGTWASAGILGAAGILVLLVTKAPASPKAAPSAMASGRLWLAPRAGTGCAALSAGLRF